MPGLPWYRMDSNIASNDKILHLLADPSRDRWQAAASYMFACGWSQGQGTDGRVPSVALGFVHGNAKTARLLVKYRLWTEAVSGYQIVNFGERNPSSELAEAAKSAQSLGGRRGNCKRHHGDLCWKDGRCSREVAS